jgi:hypothetical protein
MFLWLSCDVWWRRDGFQLSSACCQVDVGACGHVLSCQALNVTVSRGPGFGGAYPILEAPRHIPGQGDEVEWADKL